MNEAAVKIAVTLTSAAVFSLKWDSVMDLPVLFNRYKKNKMIDAIAEFARIIKKLT